MLHKYHKNWSRKTLYRKTEATHFRNLQVLPLENRRRCHALPHRFDIQPKACRSVQLYRRPTNLPHLPKAIWDETFNTTPKHFWAILLVVCRLLPPNHLIPTHWKVFLIFILRVESCVFLHLMGGAEHKPSSFGWLYTFQVFKLDTDKTKVMVFFSSGILLRFPPSRTMAHLWNLSLHSNTLQSLLPVMEACTQLLRRWQTASGLPLPEFTELVTARVSGTESMPCYGFSRSLLWQLVYAAVKYGPLLLWHMIPQKSPLHMSFILASWKGSWVSRKVLIFTQAACSAKQVRCPFSLFVQMHHTILEQFTLFKQSSPWESCADWPSYCK